MTEAFHSNWTTPFFSTNKNKEYFIEDFEILTTILSALKWREQNGKIKMITDEIGAEYYRKIGIDMIWDLGIDDTLNIDNDIDPFLFWAAGKIYSLKKQSTPCCMIDTDFIVWQPIKNKIQNSQICTIHSEEITCNIYPDKDYFNVKKNYRFDEKWDWSVRPCNTAFTYISDEDFKRYYTQESINFMKNLVGDNNTITSMVFAEQRIISMCANKMGIHINNLYDLETLKGNKQTYFSHIWGYKSALKSDFKNRNDFCIKCIKRILKDFPEYENVIANINMLQYYYRQIQNS